MNYKILITFIFSIFAILGVLALTMPVWGDYIIWRRRNKGTPEGVREAQERAALSGDPHAIERNIQADREDICFKFWGFVRYIGLLMFVLCIPLEYRICCRILSLLGVI